MRFLDVLLERFQRHADRPALELPGGCCYTYAQWHDRGASVARWLRDQGVDRGDSIVLYLSDKHAFLLAHLGSLLAGLVPLPLNPKFTPSELAYFLRDSGAKGVVCDDGTQRVARDVAQHAGSCRVIEARQILEVPAGRHAAPVDCRGDDPALLLYSSGTTGEPKGVVHTQENLARAVSALADFWRFTPDDVLANVLPLFHIHGLSFATHVCWLTGASMLVGASFHPRRTLDLVDRATVFMGVPPYYYSLLDRPDFPERAARWKRLRLVTCGSAPIRPDVLPRLEEILGQPLINRYGMTESHVITSLPLATSPAASAREGGKPGSVGIPLDGIELKLVPQASDAQPDLRATRISERAKPDDASSADAGEVHIRGPNLFRAYWNRPEATRAAFDADGWFATGDLGRLDADGYLTLVGRSKDLIIVGGYNVYPAVVERVLAGCPGVREAAVFGLPDPKRGQRVAAAVVPITGGATNAAGRAFEGALKGFCRQHLVDYQCPSAVFVVPELPRNTMGKVLRRELQKQFEP
jgi:malonyl-CoA/methylmalonyl-CoA synthetase